MVSNKVTSKQVTANKVISNKTASNRIVSNRIIPNRKLDATRAFTKQSGTALITVILVSAIMIILVTESVKSLRLQKQLSSNLINRDQAYSYLLGMEELAKVLLKRVFDNSENDVVHLNQPWAQEKIVFPIDGGSMQAEVKDMQSCFNLNSIMLQDEQGSSNQGTQNQQNTTSTALTQTTSNTNVSNNLVNGGFAAAETRGQNVLEELIRQVNENSNIQPNALATAARDWIDSDTEPAGPDGIEDDYYQSLEIPYRTANGLIAHSTELRSIKGFDQATYYKILPHICVLPDEKVNQININTIDKESAVLIYALLGSQQIQLSTVKEAISKRPENGYESVEEFLIEFGVDVQKIKNTNLLSVKSDYFQVTSSAKLGNTMVAMKTLFKKEEDNTFKVVSRYFGKE